MIDEDHIKRDSRRPVITEEPIISTIAPIIDADADYIQKLREARERQLSEMSQSERAAMMDTDAEQKHRFNILPA